MSINQITKSILLHAPIGTQDVQSLDTAPNVNVLGCRHSSVNRELKNTF